MIILKRGYKLINNQPGLKKNKIKHGCKLIINLKNF